MDIALRTHEFVRAIGDGSAAAFVAPGLQAELDGAPVPPDVVLAALEQAPPRPPRATNVAAGADEAVVDWVWPGFGRGSAVLQFDTAGHVTAARVLRSGPS